jgi:hypothetical protein
MGLKLKLPHIEDHYASPSVSNPPNESDDDGDNNNNNNDGENENYDASHLLLYSSSKKSFPHFDDHLMQNILSYVGEFQYRFT